MNIVLFCGGRGSATIIEALLEQPDVNLTLIVNAYDDGKSTGSLRRLIPGMLGPSDFRKNISYLLDLAIPENQDLKTTLEYRFPQGATKSTVEYQAGILLGGLYRRGMSSGVVGKLFSAICTFFEYTHDKTFDYSDCSFGNLIFAGIYLSTGSFNETVTQISAWFKLRAKLLNVSKGECCVLQALKEDGTFLPNEAAIVGEQSKSPIVASYLVAEPVTQAEMDALPDLDRRADLLFAREVRVELSPQADSAIRGADIIIYGPGTQHSSLLPSYRIARLALAEAPAPVKALVVNLEHDHDIQGWNGGDLVDKAMDKGANVTHILCNIPTNWLTDIQPGPLYAPDHRGAKVILGTFANGARHDGWAIVNTVMMQCQK